METIKFASKSIDSVYEWPFNYAPNFGLYCSNLPTYRPDNPWIFFASAIGTEERSTSTITNISSISSIDAGFVPKTSLGTQLLSLRENAIAEGMKLLNKDEILEEVRYRRGEE